MTHDAGPATSLICCASAATARRNSSATFAFAHSSVCVMSASMTGTLPQPIPARNVHVFEAVRHAGRQT